MPVVISLLRAVNLGSHNRMKMEVLRAVYTSLGFTGVQTYVQSGNVVFRTHELSSPVLVTRIEDAIQAAFGFRVDLVNRTTAEMRGVTARNPFPGREPDKLLVTFLAADPGEEARARARAVPVAPEEFHAEGSELYTYYPNGQGRSKFPAAAIGKALGVNGTARNWNTVTALLKMAEALEQQ
jgi:uncharacterized protein (DUF1697 family)